jgi:hypothetical protein
MLILMLKKQKEIHQAIDLMISKNINKTTLNIEGPKSYTGPKTVKNTNNSGVMGRILLQIIKYEQFVSLKEIQQLKVVMDNQLDFPHMIQLEK